MFTYFKTHKKSETTSIIYDDNGRKVPARYYTYFVEFRLKFLPFLFFIRQMHKRISIEFSEEVGSGRGSFKGGMLGTNAPLNNKTPLEFIYSRDFD